MYPTYRPVHITPTTQPLNTPTPVFPFVNTTGQTIITQAGVNTITPVSMQGITPYELLMIYGGEGIPEIVQVLEQRFVTATTFQANFANLHGPAAGVGYSIVSQKPGELGSIDIRNPGTNAVLTLYNGAPALAGGAWGNQGSIIGQWALSPTTPFVPPGGHIDNTLYYSVTGSGFDITLWYLPRYY